MVPRCDEGESSDSSYSNDTSESSQEEEEELELKGCGLFPSSSVPFSERHRRSLPKVPRSCRDLNRQPSSDFLPGIGTVLCILCRGSWEDPVPGPEDFMQTEDPVPGTAEYRQRRKMWEELSAATRTQQPAQLPSARVQPVQCLATTRLAEEPSSSYRRQVAAPIPEPGTRRVGRLRNLESFREEGKGQQEGRGQ